MKRVFVFTRNKIEQKHMQQILSNSLLHTEIIVPLHWGDAFAVLDEQPVDLLIVDIGRFDMYHCNLVEELKKRTPTTPIIITTAGLRKDVAGQIWRMGVQEYLLKPYRPEWLVSTVQTLLSQEPVEESGKNSLPVNKYIQDITGYLRDFQYKKCVDTAREYLDFIAANVDNIAEIRANTLAFVEGLVELCESPDQSTQWKLASIIEAYRLRYDLQGRKYDSFLICEKIFDVIFTATENDKFYKISDEQKILNYIDRRIKQGVSLDDVSEYANMSSCYFSKVFRKIVGVNFIAYVTDQRIEIAQQMLLDTDMPVINIAYELSYSETNYFSKAFKKKVGVTPTEYRNAALKQ